MLTRAADQVVTLKTFPSSYGQLINCEEYRQSLLAGPLSILLLCSKVCGVVRGCYAGGVGVVQGWCGGGGGDVVGGEEGVAGKRIVRVCCETYCKA